MKKSYVIVTEDLIPRIEFGERRTITVPTVMVEGVPMLDTEVAFQTIGTLLSMGESILYLGTSRSLYPSLGRARDELSARIAREFPDGRYVVPVVDLFSSGLMLLAKLILAHAEKADKLDVYKAADRAEALARHITTTVVLAGGARSCRYGERRCDVLKISFATRFYEGSRCRAMVHFEEPPSYSKTRRLKGVITPDKECLCRELLYKILTDNDSHRRDEGLLVVAYADNPESVYDVLGVNMDAFIPCYMEKMAQFRDF